MQRDVRIGDGCLLEIFIHAAATANKPTLEFDCYSSAAFDLGWFFAILRCVVTDPIDALLEQLLVPFFAGGNVDAFAAAVDDLRLIALGVDLQLEIVGWLPGRDLADDFYGLARGEHAIHASGGDADALLAAAHAEAVKLAAI